MAKHGAANSTFTLLWFVLFTTKSSAVVAREHLIRFAVYRSSEMEEATSAGEIFESVPFRQGGHHDPSMRESRHATGRGVGFLLICGMPFYVRSLSGKVCVCRKAFSQPGQSRHMVT